MVVIQIQERKALPVFMVVIQNQKFLDRENALKIKQSQDGSLLLEKDLLCTSSAMKTKMLDSVQSKLKEL